MYYVIFVMKLYEILLSYYGYYYSNDFGCIFMFLPIYLHDIFVTYKYIVALKLSLFKVQKLYVVNFQERSAIIRFNNFLNQLQN